MLLYVNYHYILFSIIWKLYTQQIMSTGFKKIRLLCLSLTNLNQPLSKGAYILSPLMMYRPSITCSTPLPEENTRSWLSSKIKFTVWSKPLRVPWNKTKKQFIYYSFLIFLSKWSTFQYNYQLFIKVEVNSGGYLASHEAAR